MTSRLATLPALLIALPVSLALSSCSAVGNEAASVGDASISVSTFEDRLSDLVSSEEAAQEAGDITGLQFQTPGGRVDGNIGREVLSLWILRQIADDALAAVDQSITDDDVAAAEEQVGSNPALGAVDDVTREWLADLFSAQVALGRVVGADEATRDPILEVVEAAEVSVSSRYGIWDPAAVSVVPLGTATATR